MKGNLAFLDGKPDEAIELYRRANEIQPWHEYLIIGYTQALILTGKVQEAEQLARQLIERKKDFVASLPERLSQHLLIDRAHLQKRTKLLGEVPWAVEPLDLALLEPRGEEPSAEPEGKGKPAQRRVH
jgi:tetratricopeptide (TPR) repeat protein